jgi:hypothetical protein
MTLTTNDVYAIVPGHDPLVMSRYPAVARELERMAVRLDVMPVNAVKE